MAVAWKCAGCGSRMKTLFPKRIPTGTVSFKSVGVPVTCAVCGALREIDVPDRQPLDGMTTVTAPAHR
jgi:hypothetical protein